MSPLSEAVVADSINNKRSQRPVKACPETAVTPTGIFCTPISRVRNGHEFCRVSWNRSRNCFDFPILLFAERLSLSRLGGWVPPSPFPEVQRTTCKLAGIPPKNILIPSCLKSLVSAPRNLMVTHFGYVVTDR